MSKPWDLRERTILFTISIIRFCRGLPKTPEAAEIASQLRRASGSVGSHYSASKRAKSDRDFITKMDGGIEEGDECMFWLDVLIRADITRDPKAEELRGEANELVSILVASRSTAVARVQRNKQAKRRAKNRN